MMKKMIALTLLGIALGTVCHTDIQARRPRSSGFGDEADFLAQNPEFSGLIGGSQAQVPPAPALVPLEGGDVSFLDLNAQLPVAETSQEESAHRDRDELLRRIGTILASREPGCCSPLWLSSHYNHDHSGDGGGAALAAN